MRTHPKTAAMYADNDLLATYHRIGHLLVERYAGRTSGCILVSGSELCVLTATAQVSGAVQRLRKLVDCSPVIFFEAGRDASEVPPGWLRDAAGVLSRCERDASQSRSSAPTLWVLGLPNFSIKQGFVSKNERRKVKEPDTSDSESDTDTEGRGNAPQAALASKDMLSEAMTSKLVEMAPKGITYTPEQVQAWFAVVAPKMRARGIKQLARAAPNWWSRVTHAEVQEAVEAQGIRRLEVLRKQREQEPEPETPDFDLPGRTLGGQRH